ncbi:MAG: hypothetical protein SGCHY_005410 [Lobulomycetales sp.]
MANQGSEAVDEFSEFADLLEDEDLDFDEIDLDAIQAAVATSAPSEAPTAKPKGNQQESRPAKKQSTILQAFGLSDSHRETRVQKPQNAPKNQHPVDPAAITSWIYPTNLKTRDYQLNIVQTALFTNTLVSLPTGLGMQ